MTPAHGARALLHGPELTAAQWRILIDLLYREQRIIQAVQADKAGTLKASVNAEGVIEGYLSVVAELREDIQRHTGLTEC